MPIHHKITKVGLARAVLGGYLLLQYRKEMKDNYRDGNWLEAAKDTAFFSVKLLPIVAPAFVFGTLGPVWLGLGAGVIVTAIIVKTTGLGTVEEVIDLVLDPPNPVEWFNVVAPEIRKKSEEFQIGAVAWVDRRLMEGQHYLESEYQQKKRQIETGWELINKWGRWANPTPGLPFGF